MALAAMAWVLILGGCQPSQVAMRPEPRVSGSTPRPVEELPTPTETGTPIPSGTPTPTPSTTPTPPTPMTPTRRPYVSPTWFDGRIELPLIYRQLPTPTPTPTKKPTKTPKPTATPLVPWPEPLEKPGRSKIGLHVQWNNAKDIMEFVRRMKPAVIKGVDDVGFMVDVKAYSPTTITIARYSEEQLRLEGDPVEAARAFVAHRLDEYLANPSVDYWEGYNEPGVQGKMAWFAAFEAERVRVMASHGLRAAIGGFSAGVPEYEEFAQFLPAIQAAKQHNGILTLHEYDAPTMMRSLGAGLPGRPNYPDRGALTLRYRWWYEEFLKPRGLVIPLIISEAGVDGVVQNRPGPSKARGWRDFQNYWRNEGLTKDPIMFYLQQLSWYDAALQQDDYVKGCTVFTAGVIHPEWKSYDITPILRHIAVYVILPTTK